MVQVLFKDVSDIVVISIGAVTGIGVTLLVQFAWGVVSPWLRERREQQALRRALR